jgi:hypothetical protein
VIAANGWDKNGWDKQVGDFEVAIGPEAGSDVAFRVEVVRSPAGEASAVVELDVGALEARRSQVQQALLASSAQARRMAPGSTEQVVREVGQRLFTALLGTGEVVSRYRSAAAVVAERGERLRVVIRIDSPLLAGLPWEAMYDPGLGGYVCRHEQLVRHVPVPSLPAPLQVQPPLRILGVVSSPRGLAPLDSERERRQLELALAKPMRTGLIQVCWTSKATWAELQAELMDGPWHVLHYIGHGDFDPHLGEGVLALEREDDRRADLVKATQLVDLLGQAHPTPRLVILNSCSGAATGPNDLFSSTAAALVRGGTSAVVAMQYEISDVAAIAFARGLYAAIARSRGVDEAVTAGRVAVLGTSRSTLEWVTPVLYLRGDRTALYTMPAATRADPPRVADRVHEAGPEHGQGSWDSSLCPVNLLDPNAVASTARATTDRDRVVRLLSDAERIARAIADEPTKASTLGAVVKAMAATDSDRAEGIARALGDAGNEASALGAVAKVVAATDPERAERLLSDAERVAQAIAHGWKKDRALGAVAEAMAFTDPDRAEGIARAVADKPTKASALGAVAKVVAATDPDRAEGIARAITDKSRSASALGAVARAVATTDPDRAERLLSDAERIAHNITEQGSERTMVVALGQAVALGAFAEVVATTDPDRAERIARSLSDAGIQVSTLGAVAKVVAATDPHRAESLLSDAERIARTLTGGWKSNWALGVLAEAMAAADPDRAEGIARAITDDGRKASALANIAQVLQDRTPTAFAQEFQVYRGWKGPGPSALRS